MRIQPVLIETEDTDPASFELQSNEQVQERLIWQHLQRKKMLAQSHMQHESKSEGDN